MVRGNEYSEKDIEILQRLTTIETLVSAKNDRCIAHSIRLKKLEDTVGKQNMVTAVFAAIGASVVLAIKYMVGR